MPRRANHFMRISIGALALLGYLASLTVVGRVVYDGVTGDRSTAVTHVLRVDDRFEAFGQTYRGNPGTGLAAGELLVAGGCLVLLLVGRGGLRIVGGVGVLAWTLLWLGNAVVGAIIAPREPLVWVHFAFVAPPSLAAILWVTACGRASPNRNCEVRGE